MEAPSKILIVDNECLTSLLIKEVLADKYSVEIADDINTAFEKVFNLHFDIVITDYLMPGMNGFEFAKTIRQKGFTGKIILQSAALITPTFVYINKKTEDYVEQYVHKDLYEVIDYFIRKPIHHDNLIKILNK